METKWAWEWLIILSPQRERIGDVWMFKTLQAVER